MFQYSMSTVNEWSTEYNVEVDKIDEYNDSPHYWDKNVLFIKPDKKSTPNYRFRLGIQLNPGPSRGTLCIEMLFNDYKLWNKSEIFNPRNSINIYFYHTKKIVI